MERCAPGQHGDPRASRLTSGKTSKGHIGTQSFGCAGQTVRPSRGSSTRSSNVGVSRRDTTNSRPTIWRSSNSHQSAFGCVLMSPRLIRGGQPAFGHFRFGTQLRPNADIMPLLSCAITGCEQVQRNCGYSINSSASDKYDAGMVSPSALAVIRLMTNSNFVGCSTGMSPGFVPRRILSTKSAARRHMSA